MFQEACNNNSVTLNTVFIQPIVYVVVYSNGETMKSHVLYATNGLIPTDFRIVNSMESTLYSETTWCLQLEEDPQYNVSILWDLIAILFRRFLKLDSMKT